MTSFGKSSLVYVTNTRFPTEKAHGLATVKLCEAFADAGWRVEIVAPALWRRSQQDPFADYCIKSKLEIRKVQTIDLFSLGVWGKPAFLLQIISFSFLAAVYAWLKYGRSKVVFFSHDYIPLYFLSFFAKNIFYDIHHFPGTNFIYRRILRKAAGFGVQTKWKVGALEEQFGIAREKVVYWPNGTDIDEFNLAINKEEARKRLGLPRDKKIVVYTGQLFDWKGIDTLVDTAHLLGSDQVVYIIGGSEPDIKRIRDNSEHPISKVIFAGQKPHREIPLWLRAADVLVLPNTGRQKVSLYYTSPMKLFEYMAAGTPIVASATPSILEIVGRESAVLAEADNPKDFAEKIKWVFKNPAQAEALGRQAKRDVEQYTWDNRARKISQFLNSSLKFL